MRRSKGEEVDALLRELKQTMHKSLDKGNYEKAMASISTGCQILYEYNQYYVDNDFENGVVSVANEMKKSYCDDLKEYRRNENTILFYDGFGLDTRGVAKMYLNALKKNGYHIVYITGKNAMGHIPETESILLNADSSIYYIDFKTDYFNWAKELIHVFIQTSPKAMFFYTTPYDASGAVAFAVMEGLTERFLIDLTDHAFWLGVKSNDYFCGSRAMSASNQIYERGIEKNRLIKLGVNLIIEEGLTDHSGLPFDVKKERYVFSGGALYKTLGDPDNYFYRIVSHILKKHKDVYFLYAGDGDRTEMDKILAEYPERAFIISERKDFYYLIQNCTLYLNTYPMFGGMMMKYSANAGKLPITLKHDKDSDGLLLDQESRKIEYETYEDLVSDVDRLLDDKEYLSEREALLEGSVISEDRFVKNLKSTIEDHCTDYEHGQEQIDTSKFKQEFYERFDINRVKEKTSRIVNKSLFVSYPWMVKNIIRKKLKL